MSTLPILYLNRLSDLVFILARYVNREQGDVLWVPGGERSQPGASGDREASRPAGGDRGEQA